jgi:hypothetical protein
MSSLPLTQLKEKKDELAADQVELQNVVDVAEFYNWLLTIEEADYFESNPPVIGITFSGGGLGASTPGLTVPSEGFVRVFATLKSLMKSEAYKLITDVAGIVPDQTYQEFMAELRDSHVNKGIETAGP